MAGETSKNSATVPKKAAQPRKAVANSPDHVSASKRIEKKIADLGERLLR